MLRFAALFALVLLEGVNAYIRHALVMGNRLLHVSVNVKDLSKAQSFYTNTFPGLHVVPDDPQTILLTGPGKSLGIKLNSITDDIQHGNGYLGVGLQTRNAMDAMDLSFMNGGQVTMDFGDYGYAASEIPDEDEMRQTPVRYGRLQDAQEHRVEVLERDTDTSLYKIVLGVLDLNDTIEFFTKVLQMKLLRKRSNVYNTPRSASMCAYCGYEDEKHGPLVELHYAYATDRIVTGNALREITIGTSDLGYLRSHIENSGHAIITYEEGKFIELLDPNNVKIKIIPMNEVIA